MRTIEKNIKTCGLAVMLTKSQIDNFKIIRSHWKKFNGELKKYRFYQSGGNWTKYGITYKIDSTYFYLAAVPSENLNFPDNFIRFEIPKGDYEVFTHTGEMENIKKTVYEIYKVILPESNLKIENHTKAGFLHFEKYDQRFQWDKPDSEIDIYLPLSTVDVFFKPGGRI
ncbi:MAG: effector binding domain-containing protein [Spirochaetes bacterium]|nr:effector binding domain-containing protein [Spirochaetota bacterium]